MPPDGDPKVSSTIVSGIVGVLLLLIILLFALALFHDVQRAEERAKVYAAAFPEITALRNAQLEKLYGPPRWVDAAAGRVAIPIDRAMELVVRDLKSAAPPATMSQIAAPPAATNPADDHP